MFDQGTQLLTQVDTQSTIEMIDEDEDALVWGRLIPTRPCFGRIYDLKKSIITIGKRPDCDIYLTEDSPFCQVHHYSSVHFTIKRDFSAKAGCTPLLEDISSNGTFVNGVRIGKGRTQALKNNTEISLARKENKAYIFIDSTEINENKYPFNLRQKYIITKELGRGAYGEVRLAYQKFTNSKFAIKIIPKKKMTFDINNNASTQKILNEAEILKKLKHPCILQLFEVYDCPDSVYMVLELVEGGELFDKVVKIQKYDESTAKLLFYQMVLAIKYLHDNNISHRDLKPENILLKSDESNETLVKISDFGLSKFFENSMQTMCGTPHYLAPEVINSKGVGSYTNKIDNWSLGVILYIILSGAPPFSEDSDCDLYEQIKNGEYDFRGWPKTTADAKDVVKRLLCVDPNKRATLEEVLEHKWIKKDLKMKEKAHKLMYPDGVIEKDVKKDIKNEHNNDNEQSRKRFKPNSSSPNSTDQSI